jgi:hypothetical protein
VTLAAVHRFSLATRHDPYRFGARQVLNLSGWEKWPASGRRRTLLVRRWMWSLWKEQSSV